MEKFFTSLLSKVSGLYCIVVGDRDGVPIVKASISNAPENALKPTFLSTFTMASLQGGKLSIGKNKSIICVYSSYQVVQMCEQGLIITFIGGKDCNIGHIMAISQEILPLIQDVRNLLRAEQI